MAELLQYSMFQKVFFPPAQEAARSNGSSFSLRLQQLMHYRPAESLSLADSPVVVFDFETTGLDVENDRIVEIGAIKFVNMEPVAEFSTLIKPDVSMSHVATSISGITEEMLANAPPLSEVLRSFIQFFQGAILVAHNAEFDMAFLKTASLREEIELQWPCFCSLKMARVLLPNLESKGLDSLATHFGLEFEARHRSIGDVKVTSKVLRQLLGIKPEMTPDVTNGWRSWTWKDLLPYTV